MKKKMPIAFSILFLLCIGMIVTAYAQTVDIGVSEGDVFTYDLSYTYFSEDPSLKAANKIEEEMKE